MRDNVISLVRPLDDWMKKARTAMEEGEFLSATRFYRKALDTRHHPVILLEMAYAYFSLHSFETVEHLIWENLRAYPLDGEWCFLIALSAMNMGDHALARDALCAYLFIDPEGDHRDSAVSMLTTFPWKKTEPPPHGARAYTILRRHGNEIDRMLQAARMDPGGRCDARCAALLADRDPVWALHHVKLAQQKGVPRDCLVEVQLACMKSYHAMGHLQESRVAWERAGAACTEQSQVEDMVRAAIFCKEFGWAQELLDAWMHHIPCSAHLLRLYILLLEHRHMDEESAVMRKRLFYVDPWHPLRTQTHQQAEQTLRNKRSMINERLQPLCIAAREGDLEP